MKPVRFPEANVDIAKDQPEYLTLPARLKNGCVTSCWALSWGERFRVLWTGKVFFSVLTWNRPLQPQKPSTVLEQL